MRNLFANGNQKLEEYQNFKGMIYKPLELSDYEFNPEQSVFGKSSTFNTLIPNYYRAIDSPAVNEPSIETSTRTNSTMSFDDYLINIRNSIEGITAYDNIEITHEDTTPVNNDLSFEDFKKSIIMKETGKQDDSAYKVVNMNTNNGKPGSGAWGAYQFIWHWHKDKIKELYGITDPNEFLNDKLTQDLYFKDYWYDKVLIPNLKKFKEMYPDSGLTNKQILDGMHFRGVEDFFNKYKNKQFDIKTESNNPSISQRLGI